MAGKAGELIGTGVVSLNPIGGNQAFTDGGTTARGSLENFIGFGKGLTNQVQSMSDGTPIEDFNATDDTVTEANSLGQSFAPTYTGDILSWEDTTP